MDNDLPVYQFEIPKDGKDKIEIGNFDFEFIESKCDLGYGLAKSFTFLLTVRTDQIEEATKDNLLIGNPYCSDELEIKLPTTNICRQGVPKSEMTFKRGSTTTYPLERLSVKGTDGLHFFDGTVTMRDGWLSIHGVLKGRKSAGERQSWPINIIKKIDIDRINWALYPFTLPETKGIQPELITNLTIRDLENTTVPELSLIHI